MRPNLGTSVYVMNDNLSLTPARKRADTGSSALRAARAELRRRSRRQKFRIFLFAIFHLKPMDLADAAARREARSRSTPVHSEATSRGLVRAGWC